ncbi:MAG: hypothetical protein U0838_00690 [Chloroflexota bacterium]
MPDVEARFGPTEGGDEAWAALEAALDDGWVVRVDGLRSPAAARDALARSARARGCWTHWHRDERIVGSWWAWWSVDHALRRRRAARAWRAAGGTSPSGAAGHPNQEGEGSDS